MLLRRTALLALTMFATTSCVVRRPVTIQAPLVYAVDERVLLQNDFEQASGGSKIYFDFDSSTLSREAKGQLKKQAEWLLAHPDQGAIIEGHCDEIGTIEYNQALGLRRANAASKFLTAQSIKPERLRVVSYGKERPEILTKNRNLRQLNRRAVTIIIK